MNWQRMAHFGKQLLFSFGHLQGQVIPLYSEFTNSSHLCHVSVSAQHELWEVPLTPPSNSSLPEKSTSREEERLERQKKAQKWKESAERTEHKENIKMQGGGNVVAQSNVFILTPIYPNCGLAVVLLCHCSDQEKIVRGLAPYPTQPLANII